MSMSMFIFIHYHYDIHEQNNYINQNPQHNNFF